MRRVEKRVRTLNDAKAASSLSADRACQRSLAHHLRSLLFLIAIAMVMLPQAVLAGTVKYIHTDALGSVVAVTDEQGEVIERREYEPYGYQLTPTIQDGPGYTGHVQDASTGLTYMQQRYYEPQLGLFLSVDPITAYINPLGQFHRYRYANNNPYVYVDPDGRNALTAFGGVIHETGQWAQGNGFDGDMVLGALRDGYNGEGGGAFEAALQDVTAFGGGGAALGGKLLLRAGTSASSAVRVAILARRSHRSWDDAGNYLRTVSRDIAPTGGRSATRTVQGFADGGQNAANAVFGRLTNGRSTPTDGGHLGRLSDGSAVFMNTRTLSNGSTQTSIRIQRDRPGSRIKENIKVRFDE